MVGPKHIVVIGGGIVGLATACFLVRRGVRVTVVERDTIEDSASTGNAGQVALGHGPLPRPGLAMAAMRWMLDGSSPLYIRPRIDGPLLAWLWQFRRACGRRQYVRNFELLAAWGLEAGRCLTSLIEDEGLDVEYRPEGRMEVYREAKGLAAADREAAVLRDNGYDVECLDAEALLATEPAFRDGLAGAMRFRDSYTVAPHELVPALARAVADHGAVFEIGRAVREITVDHGRARGVALSDGDTIDADAVVLAAGIWSMGLAARLGVRIPMQAGKGYHLELPRPASCPTSACVLAERFVAVTPFKDRLRLAGTLEFTGVNHQIHDRRVERLRAGAAAYLRDFPAGGGGEGRFATNGQDRWCGLRPCTADGLPVVGWAPGVQGVFVATGHAMMGLTLGPLTGRLAAARLLGDDVMPAVPTSPLEPARFVR